MSVTEVDNDVDSILGFGGMLSERLADFSVRPAQLAMAKAVETALAETQTLIIEAGTGTGKTFAYLIPAILSRKKTIISTGTKNLQDQLYHKDLAFLKKMLPVTAALLKGRQNYLCLYRLELALQSGLFHDKQTVSDLHTIEKWKAQTKTGDIAEVENVAEDSSIWKEVTSTVENCLGSECPLYEECHIVKARRQAMQADIIIVNHHLFFADLAIKKEGFGEILPSAEFIVFDEAHQVPEVAAHFFSENFSSRQLIELCRDTERARLQEAPDMLQLKQVGERLEKSVMDLRLSFGIEPKREAWRTPDPQQASLITTLQTEAALFKEVLASQAERGPGLKQSLERMEHLLLLLSRMTQTAPIDHIHWYETFTKNFAIYLTPLHIDQQIAALLTNHERTILLTSATLAIGTQFDYFAKQMGMTHYQSLQLASPFDYRTQALLYLPRHIPLPTHPTYTDQIMTHVLPMIERCRGRTFILFTSYQAMRNAYAFLSAHTSLPLLLQGDQSKHHLIQEFCEKGNAILLGTYSFWEGVDVRGSTLSCVIIDKLPFASPGDPIIAARIQHFAKQQQDAFTHYQLPLAVVALKQGMGRLIRDSHDKGLLIITDPRLATRAYGSVFFASLPAFSVTREPNRVYEFIDEHISV